MAPLAGPPGGHVVVPVPVQRVAEGRPVRAVWENQLGGLTFEVGAPGDDVFVKWAPSASGLDLGAEAERMTWVGRFSRVPLVLALGRGAGDEGSWLVTEALRGESAVSERWRRDPRAAVRAIGAGLRHLHDAAPPDACPYRWDADLRAAEAHRLAAEGEQSPADWHPEYADLPLERALAIVAEPPPVDRLVVCHGDACAPNTLVHEGAWSGHVDLGSLGVADRWADLAVATWSTQWNYGPGWEDELLDSYGVEPDQERTAYYRLLWDLS